MLSDHESTLEAVSTYAERFKEGLARKGKTRRGAADAIGISVQAVGAIANGKSKSATAENNAKAAAYFGCDANWLATGKGSPGWDEEMYAFGPGEITDHRAGSGQTLLAAEMQVRAILADEAVRQLLIDLADLPPARRSQILDMVHGYAEDARAAHEHLLQRKAVASPAPSPTPSAAASRSGSKARRSMRIRIGDGNPEQGSLELRLVEDPFTAEPDQRELELYHRISKDKTHRQ